MRILCAPLDRKLTGRVEKKKGLRELFLPQPPPQSDPSIFSIFFNFFFIHWQLMMVAATPNEIEEGVLIFLFFNLPGLIIGGECKI